jgi:hypothetical protein
MSTPAEITTAEENLHDIKTLRESKEFKRYFVDKILSPGRDQFLKLAIDDDSLSYEDREAARRCYKLMDDILTHRMERDEEQALKLVEQHRLKTATKA